MDAEGQFVSLLIIEICKKVLVPHKCKKHGDCEYEMSLNKKQHHNMTPINKNNAVIYFYDGTIRIRTSDVSKDIDLCDQNPIGKAADIITVLLTHKQTDEWEKIRNQKPIHYKNSTYDGLLRDIMFQSLKSQVDELCSLSGK